MFQKDMRLGYLLDFYGDILPDRKRDVLNAYYNEDLSLSEIADELGISRQGVHDLVKKGEELLLFYEEKLGLAKKFQDAEKCVSKLMQDAQAEHLSSLVMSDIEELGKTLL